MHTVIRELACSLAAPQSAFVCGFDFAFCTDAAIFMGEREGRGEGGSEVGETGCSQPRPTPAYP